MDPGKRTTYIGIAANTLLFAAKLFVGLVSHSLAVLSDAANSFTDIISSIGIAIAYNVSQKKADTDHPFGHHSAQPIAGLVVAILAGILGFEIIRGAVTSLFTKPQPVVSSFAIGVFIFTFVVKLALTVYFTKMGRMLDSPAIRASAVDCRNDVLVSILALAGIGASYLGYPIVDPLAAIGIALFILYSGYEIGKENTGYLMGKSPSQETRDTIKKKVCSVEGIKGYNNLRAHYFGNHINLEVHIEVDGKLSTQKSHAISKAVQKKLEELPIVNNVFIHIDPV